MSNWTTHLRMREVVSELGVKWIGLEGKGWDSSSTDSDWGHELCEAFLVVCAWDLDQKWGFWKFLIINLKAWLALLSCSSLVLLLFLSIAASSLLFFLFIASAKVTANCQVECQLRHKEIIENSKAGGTGGDEWVTCQPGRGTCHGPCRTWRRETGARLEGSPGLIFAEARWPKWIHSSRCFQATVQ